MQYPDTVPLWFLMGCSKYYSKCVCVCVFMFLHVSVGLEAVQQLSVETESEGSVRVRWGRVGGVTSYRLVWGPFTGQPTSNNSLRFCQSVFFFFLPLCISLYFYCSQRSKCGDCGACWRQWVSHFAQPAARHWVYRHYHPAVWGQHWGPCSDSQVQDR